MQEQSIAPLVNEAAKLGIRIKALPELPPPASQEDNPHILIRGPLLIRGGSMLINGPSGIGKSSFAHQLSIHLGAGCGFAGFIPNGEYWSWIIQDEDSDDRISTDRDDTLSFLKENQPDVKWTEAAHRVTLLKFSHDDKGARFIAKLGKLLGIAQRFNSLPDIIIINPLSGVIDGDISQFGVCNPFFKGGSIEGDQTNGLIGLLEAYDIGGIIFHHTGKVPTSRKDYAAWLQSATPEYLACGSSAIVNFTRSCITMLRDPDNYNHIILLAGKNCGGLSWEDRKHVISYGDGKSCVGGDRAHYYRELTADELEFERQKRLRQAATSKTRTSKPRHQTIASKRKDSLQSHVPPR